MISKTELKKELAKFGTTAENGIKIKKSQVIAALEKVIKQNDTKNLIRIFAGELIKLSDHPKFKGPKDDKKPADKKEDKSTKAEWGFDLTSITAENWKKVLKEAGASTTPVLEEYAWVWKGKGVTLYTGNDPITGKYGSRNYREKEVDYASYIGIDGDKEKVKKLAGLIKELADNIKEESPRKRDFI